VTVGVVLLVVGVAVTLYGRFVLGADDPRWLYYVLGAVIAVAGFAMMARTGSGGRRW
jgi:hypothetical protein